MNILQLRREKSFLQAIRINDVIGRRAVDVRSTLSYDKGGRIVYPSGHAVVVLGSRGRLTSLVEKDPNQRE